MQIRNTLCIALLFCSSFATANSLSNNAQAIYQNSSAEIRVEQLSAQIGKLLTNSGAHGNKAISDQIEQSITRAYSLARFERHVIRSIENSLNRQEQKKIIEWLDTPLGRKAALAEALALMVAGEHGMGTTIEKSKGLESKSKAALVDVVAKATMESALQLDISVYQKSIAAFAASAPKSTSTVRDYSTFQDAAESRRRSTSNLNQIFSRSLVGLAYADMSKPEIKAIISFWGSPTGTRFSVALRDGISEAFDDANHIFNIDVKNIVSSNSPLASAE